MPHSATRRFFLSALVLPLALALGACSTTGGGTTSAITPNAAAVPPLPSERYAAIVVDATSGRKLYGYEDGSQRFPASMTKMMTLYMLFEQMQSGRINKTTIIPVSPYAAARPPTKIGFKPGEGIDVDSAIKALVTRSANDVATAIGEFLGGGSEQQFALMMTDKARSIGMRDTRFQNASGLPDPLQVTTPKDMATLAIMLRRQFPQYYSYFSVTEFSFRGKTVRGHNRLVGGVEGVDGIKTGYIRASGYNVATSVTRGGRRLVVVVMGADSSKQRDGQVAQLIDAFLPSRNGPSSLPGALAVLDPGALPGVVAE
ncbi:D-alanyl-D-alanine carboxypeptidase family protein [Tianweitania populi]|uniref:Penicillin-binding protein n=1 Tax=Tianweitania populi TaxID=1607949 RepID=A0A8J3DXB6_9HYPH|nr:D-alanyl-D-alanine carboxypeptidase family protein [Tianweitania populi]GHD15884.1 penicillin-binding protein [Tianweitania populi]